MWNGTNFTVFPVNNISYVLYLSSSLLGICFNLLAFSTLLHMSNKKFFQISRLVIFNSIIVNLNDAIVFIYLYVIKESVILVQSKFYYENFKYVFYLVNIFYPVWSTVYSFGSLLDSYLVYERIQLLRIDLRFLKNTPVWIITPCLLLGAFALNISVYLAREVNFNTFELTNKTLYFADKTYIAQNPVFIYYTYFNNFFRDAITILIDVILNILLIQSMKRFNARHLFLSNQSSSSHLKKSERKNIIIAGSICSMAVFIHFVSFISFILFTVGQEELWRATSLLNGILHSIKNSLNFFIYLLLNKKFRNKFFELLFKFKCQPLTVEQITSEDEVVNNLTVTTKL